MKLRENNGILSEVFIDFMGYKTSAIKGVTWMSGFRIVTRGITFLKTVIIARVLTPSQFGLFGIVTLVLALLEMLTETGINVVLIQSQHAIDEIIDSAWVISILRGIIICLLIIITAPIVSKFFNSPQAYGLLLLISTIPLARGFINPAEITFQKELKFNQEFIFRTVLFFFDALVSVILVVMYHSVYGMVIGMLAGVLLEVVISFLYIRPLPRIVFRNKYIKDIFHKGKWVTIFGIFNYFAQEGDNIVVGRVLGAGALGVYEMAYNISILPISEVTDVVSKVVFPVYSKIEGDRQRLKKAFTKSTFFISVITFVMGIAIFIFSRQIILIVLGDKWLSALSVLRVLAIYGILRAISGSASAVFLAMRKQHYVTVMTFFRFAGLAITIYPLVKTFGMVGAGYSALISVLIEIPVILFYVRRIFSEGGRV